MNHTLPEQAGIVIVGAGMVGLEVAAELERRGVHDVLLLEAGPARDLVHVNAAHSPDEALRMWLDPAEDPHFWQPWTSACAPHYTGVSGLRRRLGGRSLYWHGVILPIESWAMHGHWPAPVIHDLTVAWEDGPSLLERTARDLDRWAAGTGEADQGPEKLVIGDFSYTRTPQAVRAVATDEASPRWEAYTPLAHWETAPDTVVPDTMALNVEVDDGHVTGVRVRCADGTVRHIRTRTVVLAAGTTESTRIVAQSLGGPERFGGLVDHLAQGFVVALRPESAPPDLLAAADANAFFCAAADSGTRANQFVRLYRNSTGAVVLDTWLMGEQLADEAGYLDISPSDSPDEPWQVEVNAALSGPDRTALTAQRNALQRFWAAVLPSAAPLRFPDFDSAERILEHVLPRIDTLAPDELPITWTRPLGTEYHEAGTLPFGSRLTDDQELRDLPGVHLAGAAVFPRSGAANPSLVCLALARRLAAELARGATP
ncbi:GMC oxidoreductase [Streptomyces sp. NPDC057496]|uniref:GMC oxidoreductase n=1 Tax=Streptomyces sp. NPDC057496 TaxID=3346149 RepID=UPI003674C5D8